jgi:predicted metal-dependent phosphoesterase TrpH
MLEPAPDLPRRDGARRPRSRARRWLPGSAALASVLVVAGAAWRVAPVDALGVAAHGGGVDATLRLPAAYVLFSPLCEGYDALTLLTLNEHGVLLAWLLVAFAVFRVVRRRRSANVRQRAARTEGLLLAACLLGFVASYMVGALVPRPMAALELRDRDELAVDVHSHTSASHDGRRDFDAEASRRWHAAAGFAAAYVTDHRYFSGAVAGERGNPRRAGDGTVLLSGLESAAAHSRLLILGAREPMGLDHNGRADLRRLATDTNVVVVLTTPASLASGPRMRLDAVESSDGAPRGLMFTRRLEPEIGRFAQSRGLARVAGSNNHGWGRTASAWTVLRVPGWRAMSPAALDSAIRSTLRHPRGLVRVVARGSTPLPRSLAALVATPALIAWSIVSRLSLLERLSWLAWIWGATGLAVLLAARRRRPPGGVLPDGVMPNGGASSAARAPRFPARGRRVALRGR